MATGFAAALLVIAGLVPTAYNITAGFTLQNLREERVQLEQQRAKLATAEAKLVSPDRLRQLAKGLKMAEPEPQQLETLQGTTNAEARNAPPAGR
jgi:hypothetical protein